MASRSSTGAADIDLLASNYAELNEQYYEHQPWTYFSQRLSHLMLVASHDERHQERIADGVDLGPVRLSIARQQEPAAATTPEQTFAAIDAEVLLHHSAETLLRLVHAHSQADPCPWLRMSRVRSPRDFKEWVRAEVSEPELEAVDALCRRVFAVETASTEQVRTLTRWLRLFAAEFLDADAYNAAKHGLSLSGASERWTLEVAGRKLLEHDGASLTWLSTRPDESGRMRWAETSRLFSVESTATMIFIATRLMNGVWDRGRATHLGEEAEPFEGVSDTRAIDETFGTVHRVLEERERPLAYPDNSPTMILRTRLRRPTDPETS